MLLLDAANCDSITTDNPAGLDPGIAIALVGNYAANHLAWINAGMNPVAPPGHGQQANSVPPQTDSRSAWFSLYALKKFICQIENNSLLNCQIEGPDLGIRIYYGEYPASTASDDAWAPFMENGLPAIKPCPPNWGLPEFKANYGGKHTLMMVPTFYDGSTMDFYGNPLNVDFDPNFSKPVTDSSGTVTNAPMPMSELLSVPMPSSVLMMDHSSIHPPPWKADLAGETSGAACGTTFMDCVDAVMPLP